MEDSLGPPAVKPKAGFPSEDAVSAWPWPGWRQRGCVAHRARCLATLTRLPVYAGCNRGCQKRNGAMAVACTRGENCEAALVAADESMLGALMHNKRRQAARGRVCATDTRKHNQSARLDGQASAGEKPN